MKVHRYQRHIHPDLDYFVVQECIHIPDVGVIKCSEGKIDSFDTDEESMSILEYAIGGRVDGGKYFGEVDVPDDVINQIISDGLAVNEAKEKFQESGKKL